MKDEKLDDMITKATDNQSRGMRNATYKAMKGFVQWQAKEVSDNHSKDVSGWIRKATEEPTWEDFIKDEGQTIQLTQH